MSAFWSMAVFGCLGGLLPDILRIIKNRHSDMPQYLKQGYFWVSLLLLALTGALTAFLLDASSGKEAVAYGFAAPELLSRLLSVEAGVDRGIAEHKVRTWWSL